MFNEFFIMRDIDTWEMSDKGTIQINIDSSLVVIPAVTLTISSRDPPPMRNIDNDGFGLTVALHL